MYGTKCFRTFYLFKKCNICWAKEIEAGVGGANILRLG